MSLNPVAGSLDFTCGIGSKLGVRQGPATATVRRVTVSSSSFDALAAWADRKDYGLDVFHATSGNVSITVLDSEGAELANNHGGVDYVLSAVAPDQETAATHMLRRLVAGEYAWRGEKEPDTGGAEIQGSFPRPTT